MKRAVIFDLDGTLLNSLGDLTSAANAAMRSHGFPEHSLENVRRFVGNGVPMLIHRAVPEGTSPEEEARCLSEFRSYYSEHMVDQTVPYPGILALLEELKERGFLLAVVSNKFELLVQKLCRHLLFGCLDAAVGDREGFQKKPAPDNLLRCMDLLQVKPEEVIYVGDSPTDIETAENTGVDFIGVLWGFRDEWEMREATTAPMAKTAEELKSLIVDFQEGRKDSGQ
ncbi:HAD family hydrolase [Hominifimenecus sp. rT4P-3]|uniref:HAD family hydrolase n=1 Tax=Hominifimenecus sp. rT4P-3 TaxID=3242979 RepID=UPI003DA375DA